MTNTGKREIYERIDSMGLLMHCRARAAKKYLTGEDSVRELESMLAQAITDRSPSEVIHVLGCLGRRVAFTEVKDLVSHLEKGHFVSQLIEVLDRLEEPKRTRELRKVIARKRGCERKAAEKLGVALSRHEREALLALYVQRGNLYCALDEASALGRDLTERELMRMYRKELKGIYCHLTIEIAQKLPEKKRIPALEAVMPQLIKRGIVGEAQSLAEKIGRKLTKKEVRDIIAENVSNGSFGSMRVTCEQLRRPVTLKMLSMFYARSLRNADYYQAFEVAKSFSEPRRTRALEVLFMKFDPFQNQDLAREVANELLK